MNFGLHIFIFNPQKYYYLFKVQKCDFLNVRVENFLNFQVYDSLNICFNDRFIVHICYYYDRNSMIIICLDWTVYFARIIPFIFIMLIFFYIDSVSSLKVRLLLYLLFLFALYTIYLAFHDVWYPFVWYHIVWYHFAWYHFYWNKYNAYIVSFSFTLFGVCF